MPFGILMETTGYRWLDLRSRNIRAFKCPLLFRGVFSQEWSYGNC